MKDRLWYYVTARDEGQHRSIPNIFPNLNAGDPTKFLYAPDRTREVRGAESWRLYSGAPHVSRPRPATRSTCTGTSSMPCNGATFTSSGDGCRQQPESEAVFGPLGLGGLTLDDVARDRRLSGYPPARAAAHLAVHGDQPHAVRSRFRRLPVALRSAGRARATPTRGLARVTEQCAAGCSANGGIPNLTYRSANWGHSWDAQYTWRASVSYVTGAHNLKIGYGGVALVSDLENHTNDLNLAYTVSNGVPNSAHAEPAAVHHQLSDAERVLLRAGSVDARPDDAAGRAALRSQLELLARADDSGVGFLAVAARVPGDARRDRLQGHLAARRRRLRRVRQRQDGREGELRQVPGADQQQQQLHPVESDHPHRHDDDAHAGRTPTATSCRTATCGARWRRTNGDRRRHLRGDERAARSARRRRPRRPSTRRSSSGWGVRSNDWQIGASVQQQVLPRVSVEVGYFRRWLNNFTVTDNLAVGRGRLHRSSASPRRPIRGCLAAAATP